MTVEHSVQVAIDNWAPHFVANGIDPNDFQRVTKSIIRWDDWCQGWSENGAMHEPMGDEEEGRLFDPVGDLTGQRVQNFLLEIIPGIFSQRLFCYVDLDTPSQVVYNEHHSMIVP